MEDNIIKRVASSMKCRSCGQHYRTNNIDILGHHEDYWFLSMFCPVCQSQSLVAAVVKEDKVVQLTTDLTEAESGRFSEMDRVSGNDVLDMHNFLKSFDGDFSEVFSQKK